MERRNHSFLPTLWSRLCGCNSQDLSREEQVTLIKAEILQNITLILNSRSHLPLDKMPGFEDIQYTVLGLGLADFCGKYHNQAQLAQLKQKIISQIMHFEPRLEHSSLELNFLDPENELGPNNPNYVNLEIKARLTGALSKEIFTCVSKIDLDAGNTASDLQEVAHGR